MRFLKSGIFAVALMAASAAYGQITSTQVLNNTTFTSGSFSPAISITSTEPTYTVYFKPLSVSPTSYNVYLQGSPDGVTWANASPAIYVSKYSAANLIYSVTTTVKAVKFRLAIYAAETGSVAGTASAWVVN